HIPINNIIVESSSAQSFPSTSCRWFKLFNSLVVSSTPPVDIFISAVELLFVREGVLIESAILLLELDEELTAMFGGRILSCEFLRPRFRKLSKRAVASRSASLAQISSFLSFSASASRLSFS
ncbi:hypothetical protein DOY81_003881, partial [Sarcophaga bullata]